jgi:cytochrome b
MNAKILVWDVPTRVFHWLLALSFLGAYLTGEEENYQDLHLEFGYILLGLIGFRLIWGVVGSRYARFSAFWFKPRAIMSYLQSLWRRNPEHYVGHNPAGSAAIFLLLGLGLISSISGLMAYYKVGGEWLEELHEVSVNIMLAVVLAHIAGVALSSYLHRENLPRAMLTGTKFGEPSQGIGASFAWLGVLLILAVAAFWYWFPVLRLTVRK